MKENCHPRPLLRAVAIYVSFMLTMMPVPHDALMVNKHDLY
jgi:hypothetical protein